MFELVLSLGTQKVCLFSVLVFSSHTEKKWENGRVGGSGLAEAKKADEMIDAITLPVLKQQTCPIRHTFVVR